MIRSVKLRPHTSVTESVYAGTTDLHAYTESVYAQGGKELQSRTLQKI